MDLHGRVETLEATSLDEQVSTFGDDGSRAGYADSVFQHENATLQVSRAGSSNDGWGKRLRA
jgi:hypothetical protein